MECDVYDLFKAITNKSDWTALIREIEIQPEDIY